MSANSIERKAPYRKRKTLSPETFRQYIESENIQGYPADLSNIRIACGESVCSAITASQTAVSWGDRFINSSNELKVPKGLKNLTQIACCKDYTLVLNSDGILAGWGNTRQPYSRIPSGLDKIVKIRGCETHFLVLQENGKLIGWGDNREFNLSRIPEELYKNKKIMDIGLGTHHLVILQDDGTLICWGERALLEVPEYSQIVSIKVAYRFSLALTKEGTLIGWGDNTYGQGNIPFELINGLNRVISYAVGKHHCVAIVEGGELFSWGWDVDPSRTFYQEYVTDTKQGVYEEVEVNIEEKKYFIAPPLESIYVDGEKPVRVYAGNDVTFLLMNTGDVISWGDSNYKTYNVSEVIPPLIRTNQPDIDLTPYGIALNLDTILQGIYNPTFDIFQPILSDTDKEISTPRGVYKKGRELGAGTYGVVYEVERDGRIEVGKLINIRKEKDKQQVIYNFLLETVVQIIIQEEAQKQNPPMKVCGQIYEVAYNKEKQALYIFQEKLDFDLSKKIGQRLSVSEFSSILIQLASKLNWLYDRLEFNHRDMHIGNVMIKGDEVILIDFGRCCLSYRGYRLKTFEYFDFEKCFEETRDLTQLLYSIYEDKEKYIPYELKPVIKNMLKFKVKGYTCDLINLRCGYEPFHKYDDIYELMNENYIYNPKATTDQVIKIFTPYLK